MSIPEKWRSTLTEPKLKVYMVDPHNLETFRGELTGITDCSITDGYDTDTRISGSLSTIDDNYIGGSWLRIFVDDEEIATLGPQSIDAEQAPEEAEKKSFNLQSVLWMISEDIAFNLLTVAKQTTYSQVLDWCANQTKKSIVYAPSYKDGNFSSAVAYERTDSFQSIMADVCSLAGDELGVDTHGRILISPYIAPKNKTSSWTIDADDPNGIVMDPGYSDSDDTGEAYDRTIVIASPPSDTSSDSSSSSTDTTTANDDSKSIVAYSDAPSTSTISNAYRGWTRAKVHQVSNMSPFTQAQAQKIVELYVDDDRSLGKTRDATCLYFPVKAGEVVDWIQNGKRSRYLVQTVDADLMKWTAKLTLKEI